MKINRIRKQCDAAVERLTAPQRNATSKGRRIRLDQRPEIPPERMTQRGSRLVEASDRPSPRDFERILGANDLVDLNYLARAQRAARSICRIVLRDDAGRELGYGTGFLVSPRLLLTNEHVLPDEDETARALAEFDFELDITGQPIRSTRFELDPASFFMSSVDLDFTLTAITPVATSGTGRLEDYGFHRLIRDTGKINPGESMTIIQHPAGQPKQIALRENELIEIKEQVLLYGSDTAPGSSGSPVFNDSWQIVGLHHSGVPRTDAAGNWLLKTGGPAGPDADDSEIDWLANEGIRASRIVHHIVDRLGAGGHAEEFQRVADGDLMPTDPSSHPDSSGRTVPRSTDGLTENGAGFRVDLKPGGARVTVPLSFDVLFPGAASLAAGTSASTSRADDPALSTAREVKKEPIIDRSYGDRRGYNARFLGVDLPLPSPRFPSRVAKMEDGESVIPYQHFSIVIHKDRRLALFTAANVDGRRRARRPDPDRPRADYTRAGLGGFARNDREKWALDPRIDAAFQLPDRFYNKDRQSFDKGHLIRRDIVAWGRSYVQLQKANGDTYHCTNCSPQVLDFNRSGSGGIWGQLENHVMRHAKVEKLCVFSGPLFQSNDRNFQGVDDDGDITVQIPRAYWKIITVKVRRELKAYAFLLRQDVTSVAFEDFDPGIFTEQMISISRLQTKIGEIRFPSELRDADQFGLTDGESLMASEAFVDVSREG